MALNIIILKILLNVFKLTNMQKGKSLKTCYFKFKFLKRRGYLNHFIYKSKDFEILFLIVFYI
jgi:hypothetical protein